MFPLHTWCRMPTAKPMPVSMLLAGVLLKMGGYALLRFNVQCCRTTSPWPLPW